MNLAVGNWGVDVYSITCTYTSTMALFLYRCHIATQLCRPHYVNRTRKIFLLFFFSDGHGITDSHRTKVCISTCTELCCPALSCPALHLNVRLVFKRSQKKDREVLEAPQKSHTF